MSGQTAVSKFLSYLGEDGTRAHKYWNFSGAWCCGEVAMVMKQSVGNLFYDGKKVVYCPTAYSWCKTHLQKISKANAKYGDIIFFDWNGNGVPDHIGMVEYVSGSTVHTIEGNTGSPARVRRKTRASYILGIFRPKYEPPKPEDYIVTVDGEWGYHTCLGTQYVLGVTPLDGVLGKKTVKGIQKKVGTTADGGWGKKTTLAMQKFLNKNGYTDMNGKKLVEDGEKGKSTISAWQKWINGQIKGDKPTPTPTPTPTKKGYDGSFPDLVVNCRNYLSNIARDLAYAKNTTAKVYNYKTGKPKEAFTKAIKKVYGSEYNKWSKQCRKGASCDVFVGTVLRYSGCDTSWPRGLDAQIKKTPKHMKEVSNIKAGDMMYYLQKGGGGHTRMVVDIKGTKYNCEANHNYKGGQYGHIGTKATKPTGKKMLKIFRCNSAFKAMDKGDKGSEVTKWQKFLNWAGFDCGTADGEFGEKTETATKTFQTKYGLTADGQVGEKTIAKAKAVQK